MKTSINRPYSAVTMRMHIRDEHPEPQGCWMPKKKHQGALVCCKRPDIADPVPAFPCWLEESVGAISSQLPEPIKRYKKNWGVRKHRTLGTITLVIRSFHTRRTPLDRQWSAHFPTFHPKPLVPKEFLLQPRNLRCPKNSAVLPWKLQGVDLFCTDLPWRMSQFRMDHSCYTWTGIKIRYPKNRWLIDVLLVNENQHLQSDPKFWPSLLSDKPRSIKIGYIYGYISLHISQ